MKLAEMNWMQIEAYLAKDDRVVLPLGCVEQHAYLSLATDAILAERVAIEAADPVGVPVLPVMAYGITPNFMAYPGTISVRIETLCALVRDALESLEAHGFRRVLIVNGHGGNAPVRAFTHEWMAAHGGGVRVRFHDWWSAPAVWRKVQEIDPVASHASWMENFPWTRVSGGSPPDTAKPAVDFAAWAHLGPRAIRDRLGDGNFGGRYIRVDDEMFAIWRVAVEETRALLTGSWD